VEGRGGEEGISVIPQLRFS